MDDFTYTKAKLKAMMKVFNPNPLIVVKAEKTVFLLILYPKSIIFVG